MLSSYMEAAAGEQIIHRNPLEACKLKK